MNSASCGWRVQLNPASVLYFLLCEVCRRISLIPCRVFLGMATLADLALILKDTPGGIGGTGAPHRMRGSGYSAYKSHLSNCIIRISRLTYYYIYENILSYMGKYPTYYRSLREVARFAVVGALAPRKAAGDGMERDTGINSVNTADAIKRIQQAAKLLNFLYASGELATNFHCHQIRVDAANKEVQPVLRALWQSIDSDSSVEHITGVLDNYFQMAISARLELLAAAAQYALPPEDLDRMVLSGLELLNTSASWNMLFYRSMSAAWLGARAQILEVWHSKGSGRLHAHHRIPQVISRQNIVFEQQRVALWRALLQSMLMETAGAESLTRRQIQALVEMTGCMAKRIPLRFNDMSAKRYMYIDPATRQTVWGPENVGIAGFAVAREDICKAAYQPEIHLCPKETSRDCHAILPEPRAGWIGERSAPPIDMTSGAKPAVIRFNYFGVLRQIRQESRSEEIDTLVSNCIMDHATDTGCVITLRRPVSLVASIGQLIAVSGNQHQWRCGMVIWMQWHRVASSRLSIGVEFLAGNPRSASVRGLQQQSGHPPSNLHLADLIALEDGKEENARLFIAPRNEITVGTLFQDIDRSTDFSVQSVLHAGKDFDVIRAAVIDTTTYSGVHHQDLKMIGERCTNSLFYQSQV